MYSVNRFFLNLCLVYLNIAALHGQLDFEFQI